VETGVAVVAEDPRKRVSESMPLTVESNGTAEAVSPEQAQHGDAEREAAASAVDVAEIDAVGGEVAELDVPESDVSELESVDADANDERGAAEPPLSRFTIHTARYRLTLKGVDRGKWEVDVVAEADAPLDAVEAVVRGVQRRSGEEAEPDRLTTEAFREALDAPLSQLERWGSDPASGSSGSGRFRFPVLSIAQHRSWSRRRLQVSSSRQITGSDGSGAGGDAYRVMMTR
jgi:hypothetical protein